MERRQVVAEVVAVAHVVVVNHEVAVVVVTEGSEAAVVVNIESTEVADHTKRNVQRVVWVTHPLPVRRVGNDSTNCID